MVPRWCDAKGVRKFERRRVVWWAEPTHSNHKQGQKQQQESKVAQSLLKQSIKQRVLYIRSSLGRRGGEKKSAGGESHQLGTLITVRPFMTATGDPGRLQIFLNIFLS